MRKPKQINPTSLERICQHYDEICKGASAINNLNARSSDDMVHDAIMLAATDDEVVNMPDADLANYVLYRMNTIIYEARKKQAAYSNANDLQAKKENNKSSN